MKYYKVLENGWFKTTEKETKELDLHWDYNHAKFNRNLKLIKVKFGADIIDFTIRKLPYKHSSHDKCRLLIVKHEDGSFYAKRYGNSPHFKLEF